MQDNNYPLRFIKNWKSHYNTSCRISRNSDSSNASASSTSSNLVVLPYVRGLSEKISRILCNNNVKVHVGFKPLHVLHACFPQPKDKPTLQSTGVVCNISCLDCDFVYCRQTDRALATRLKEHKRVGQVRDIAQHTITLVITVGIFFSRPGTPRETEMQAMNITYRHSQYLKVTHNICYVTQYLLVTIC